jgi:transposase InsO family protein
LIEAEKANYRIAWMCSILRVPRSSFYAWRHEALTPTQARRAELAVLVGKVFDEFRQTYGCRRIARELNSRGVACSVGLVADLMREKGLKAVQPRAYRVTTVHGVDDEYPADLIDRDFTATEPGTRLVGDITYLRTGQGWLYLATVIDLATRMVVGWQIADHMRTTLIIDALEMARLHGHLQPNAIFHSDRGTQGGFNWSSQHPRVSEVASDGDGGLVQEDQRCSRGCAPAVACGSGVTAAYALAGAA